MIIHTIISGGQTGADQAGLCAGRTLGLQTGGTAPYNWMTDTGPNQIILEQYGLTSGPFDSRIYPKRTEINVTDSDGTLLVGRLMSPGTRLTRRLCDELYKPFIENPSPEQLKEWIAINHINILNVAGNRERTNPGIFARTFNLLVKTLS